MTPGLMVDQKIQCYHCGDECFSTGICLEDKTFCCEGCKMVYQILNHNNLCTYYDLNENPGLSRKIAVREDKFAFLDDAAIQEHLISFKDEKQVHITFYLPQIHCSSCLYLLENLHRLNKGVISATVNFTRKDVRVIFSPGNITLRKVVELLTSIGYEPYISLNDVKEKRPLFDKSLVYQLGVAGFCFGNIMLMSFPEYFGIDAEDGLLRDVFRWINVVLALPVFFYAALPFYQSSFKSLRHRYLNIDAPIALAIIITFTRSMYEIITGTGSGYFDSMTGIVFFMLAGRVVQNKTYQQLSFERDYTSYFPVAVSVVNNNEVTPVSLPDIKAGDTLRIHNEELIPADGILTRGKAFIDYSFVTGESMPVSKEIGELVYAGGKQTEGTVELLVIKEVAQSYLTGLWNRDNLKNKKESKASFVDVVSRWFTYLVFTVAIITGIYWQLFDATKVWPAVTAVFIVACPCALLLSNSFTNGNILRILSRNSFYLRNAHTIETIAAVSHIVFDKTGTLTLAGEQEVNYEGKPLSAKQKQLLVSLAACATHPLSKAIAKKFAEIKKLPVTEFISIPGKGIRGMIAHCTVKMGSSKFIGATSAGNTTMVYVSFNDEVYGCFHFSNHYRSNLLPVIQQLKKRYHLSVVSGDNNAEESHLRHILGNKATLLFNQAPEDKLSYVQQLQQNGAQVMMIGDGLNDGVALKQSDVGVALAEDNNNFTPASDAILEAARFPRLVTFIRLCRANRRIVIASFILSGIYNIVGLYFAVQGILSPIIAAILMPSSSLCILLITFGSSNWLATRWKL